MKLRGWPKLIGPIAIDGPHAGDENTDLIVWLGPWGLEIQWPNVRPTSIGWRDYWNNR